MSSQGHSTPLNIALMTSPKSHFWKSGKQKISSQAQKNTRKNLFPDITEHAFWAGQKTENKFAGPVYPLKHRFLDLAQVVFWVGRKVEM
jgi:ribosomal protein L31